MNYVKVKIDGSVDKFPYSLGQLVSDNPGTSFPEQIPDVTAASFNVFPVAATPSPDYDYTKNLSSTATLNNDVWDADVDFNSCHTTRNCISHGGQEGKRAYSAQPPLG